MNGIAICLCAICAGMGGVFLLLSIVFAVGKGHATILLSGFNYLPAKRRAQYDQARLARDTRNMLALWAGVMAVGALGAILHWGVAVAALAAGVVLFFREVHWDVETAYESYRNQ